MFAGPARDLRVACGRSITFLHRPERPSQNEDGLREDSKPVPASVLTGSSTTVVIAGSPRLS
jgi:hypothetical protein